VALFLRPSTAAPVLRSSLPAAVGSLCGAWRRRIPIRGWCREEQGGEAKVRGAASWVWQAVASWVRHRIGCRSRGAGFTWCNAAAKGAEL
jgi:hypothetical protein